MKKRRLWILGALAALVPVCVVAALLVGPGKVTTPGIVRIRLTGALVAMLVGAALSGSGAILQAVVRNPLSEP